MKQLTIISMFLLGTLGALGSLVYAEDIKNYSDCDVCTGAIHYGTEETRKIMGYMGFQLASRLKKEKVVRIDMDGVLINGSEKDPDTGYEIKIWGTDILFIKNITDGSLIQIVTDHLNTSRGSSFDDWKPEIYLESGSSQAISLEDSLEVAWSKMIASNIYRWVATGKDSVNWPELLKKKILEAMQLMAQQAIIIN
jgi:hypothetical protein